MPVFFVLLFGKSRSWSVSTLVASQFGNHVIPPQPFLAHAPYRALYRNYPLCIIYHQAIILFNNQPIRPLFSSRHSTYSHALSLICPEASCGYTGPRPAVIHPAVLRWMTIISSGRTGAPRLYMEGPAFLSELPRCIPGNSSQLMRITPGLTRC